MTKNQAINNAKELSGLTRSTYVVIRYNGAFMPVRRAYYRANFSSYKVLATVNS